MKKTESRAWLIERFGTDGTKLRSGITEMLQFCHNRMSEAQERAPMQSQAVYGQIWRAVHDQILERYRSLPTAQVYRPKKAPYKIMVVNGTALFPWRYAHDAVTQLDQASFGPDVSPTRKAILAGAALPDMLPLGEVANSELPAEEAEEITLYRTAFRDAAAEHPVVVLAYASNPTALLNTIWGDARQLRDDGTLQWGWRELLYSQPTATDSGQAPAKNNRPNFASAPLPKPLVTARPKTRAAAPTNPQEGRP
jgi:hypothetical protein